MTAIQYTNVVKRFPKTAANAVDGVSFSVEAGELVTILGTSGCGKTTLLKMLNRLYEPDSGVITLFGKNVVETDAVTLRQGIGYVIQQAGLFPHMTVFDNIAVVPRLLKWEKAKIAARIEELLALVNLDPAEFRMRYPAQLSGGQQQRVGLARALAADPPVMLLDEPFGAIDAINRLSLQNELRRIHSQDQKTYLFVTHDITEAFKLGARVMVMDKGVICQFDTPEAIVRAPASGFVSDLLASRFDNGDGI